MISEPNLNSSDFQNLYKNVSQLKEHQEKRRARLLDQQRRKREEKFSETRKLKEIFQSYQKEKKNRSNDMFKNNLMLSEWMLAKPDDIEDFILVPCPKGIRVSLSTGENKKKLTRLYYQNGTKFLEVSANLPAYTILDCIYCKPTNTIFVLDVLFFNDRDMVDSDAAFRFFWLSSKFSENDYKVTDTESQLEMKLLRSHDFSDSFAVNRCFEAFQAFENGTELDGFLFFHKEGSYVAGKTPYVLWLFPFMIAELFDTSSLNQFYPRPHNYTNYLEYIKEFDENKRKRKKRSSRGPEAMDHESSEAGDTSLEDSKDELQEIGLETNEV